MGTNTLFENLKFYLFIVHILSTIFNYHYAHIILELNYNDCIVSEKFYIDIRRILLCYFWITTYHLELLLNGL